jgi:hypothetical protein
VASRFWQDFCQIPARRARPGTASVQDTTLRLLHAPLLHFVAGGALLFLLTRVVGSEEAAAPPAREPVAVTAADVAQLRNAYAAETGLQPTERDEAALVDAAIDEELLFREAVARGLDRHDRSVRTWLVEQMQVLTDDPAATEEDLYQRALQLGLDKHDLVVRRILIHKVKLLAGRVDDAEASDADLRAWYAEHAAEALPSRVTLWHVFLAADARDPKAVQHAEQALAALRERRPAPRDAVREGDSFAMPAHLVAQSQPQLEKLFGARFAEQVMASPAGAWSGPFASPYGLHLVFVESREAGSPPPFDDVRGRVLESWREAERAKRLKSLLRDLRRRYPLEIDSPAWHRREAGQ